MDTNNEGYYKMAISQRMMRSLFSDPYNPNNKVISKRQVEAILRKYGVPDKVHNFELYKRAFVHRSYVKRPHLENIERGITLVDKPDDCLPLKTKSPTIDFGFRAIGGISRRDCCGYLFFNVYFNRSFNNAMPHFSDCL